MSRVRVHVIVLASVMSLAACGLVDRAERQAEERLSGTVESAIGDRVKRELQKAGVDLQGEVDCASDLDVANIMNGVDGKVTCTGKTRKGQPVEATFDGTLSADGTCRGTVVVTVDGKEHVRTPETNVCTQG